MASSGKDLNSGHKRRPPAKTPEAREQQLISLAVDLAEKQLTEGTASTAVISHYLKLASSREKLEQAKLAKESHLMQAKIDSIESGARVEELYSGAIKAMSEYQGRDVVEEDDY